MHFFDGKTFAERWRLKAAILLAVSGCAGASVFAQSSQPARVAIVSRDRHGHHLAAAAIESAMTQAGHTCMTVTMPSKNNGADRDAVVERLRSYSPTLIVGGGTAATLLALESFPTTPVVFFMVPNALDSAILRDTNRFDNLRGGVTTDIAPTDQVDLLARLCPNVKKLGVLYGVRSTATASAIQAAATGAGIRTHLIKASKSEFAQAIDAVNRAGCDAVLMVPDSGVYSKHSVQRLLLWGIRHKKPVWGFSGNVVKAGALVGQYPDNQAIGRQTAEVVLAVLAGNENVGLRHPNYVAHAFNERTADLIDARIPPASLPSVLVRYGRKP